MKKLQFFLFLFFLFFISGFSNVVWEIKPSKYKIIEYSKQIQLYWKCNKKVNLYNVYFGKSEKNLELIYKGEKNNIILTNIYPNKKYYWKVIAQSEKSFFDSGIMEFYVKLEKPKIDKAYPDSQYNLEPEDMFFSWNIIYSANYMVKFILYKNDEKVLEKYMTNNSYSMDLLPGTNYKWYLVVRDEFKNEFFFGPYMFSTQPYETLMAVDNLILNLKVYGSYIEKNQIYKSEYSIKKFQKYGNFIFLSSDFGIEVVHKSGKKVSEIKTNGIRDFHIDKNENNLLLYLIDNEGLKIFDVTNPFYPFLKKQILGKYVSVSSNCSNILLLTGNEITLMDKTFEIYYKKNLKQLKKIIYIDDNKIIILSDNKLLSFYYGANRRIKLKKELEILKIKDFDVDNKKIVLLTFNGEIYIYDFDLNLLYYDYFRKNIKDIKLYKNILFYYDKKINFLELNDFERK
ncbi:MAG: hypothetical protein B6I29_03515 [Marinitoga sp. 4572_148]|nr:MAG: hypothetical protein B6I29_03515 [Marinitoga sp. 4572_148]